MRERVYAHRCARAAGKLRCLQFDLKVCRNCISYDARVAHQCRDGRAEPVAEKHLANYCEYFEFIRREYGAPSTNTSREAKARDTLKKLFGDLDVAKD